MYLLEISGSHGISSVHGSEILSIRRANQRIVLWHFRRDRGLPCRGPADQTRLLDDDAIEMSRGLLAWRISFCGYARQCMCCCRNTNYGQSHAVLVRTNFCEKVHNEGYLPRNIMQSNANYFNPDDILASGPVVPGPSIQPTEIAKVPPCVCK